MTVLAGLQSMSLVYVDDICVFSPDWDAHMTHLRTVMDRFRQHNLRFHPNNACLHKKR